MKTMITRLLACVVLAFTATIANAHEGHSHGTKKVAGPNGGRILASVEPRAEFFVTQDRRVRITFIDAAGKPVAVADQVVIVTTGDRASPTQLTFKRDGDVLVSENMLPPGDKLTTVVQIKPTADAKPATFRFHIDLAICDECKNAEYACICAH